MLVLMDKMYIKLHQKEVPYKPQIYQRGRGQIRQKFRQGNNWKGHRSFSRNRIESNRGYGRGRGNFRRGNFEVDLILVLVELGKTEGHGDNLDQEKEKGELGHHPVLDRD